MADTTLVPRVTSTTAANFIPEIWAGEVLRATRNQLVMADLVKRYDYLVKSKGDTIHIPNLANLSANDKAASTIVTVQANTEDKSDISINKHKETSVLIEDFAKVQSQIEMMGEYTKQAGYAIAKAVDSDLTALYSGLSQYVGDGSTDVSDANIILAISKLNAADAPMMDRSFVVGSSQVADLMAIDKFVLRTGPGWSPSDSPILNGPKSESFFGNLYGVKVYISNNIVREAATPNIDHCLLFQKEAFALAMQQTPRTQMQYKQEYLADLLTVDVIYGVAELRDAFGVDFRAKI